jgi:hypothetical protein
MEFEAYVLSIPFIFQFYGAVFSTQWVFFIQGAIDSLA